MDPAIKYGGGDEEIRRFLTTASESIAQCESREEQLAAILREFAAEDEVPLQSRQTVDDLQRELTASKHHISPLLQSAILARTSKGKIL